MASPGSGVGPLRALVAGGDGDYYGLVQSGSLVADLHRLTIEGSQLRRVAERPEATLPLPDTPVALSRRENGEIAVVHSEAYVVGREPCAFDVDEAYRNWLEHEMGAPGPIAPRSGETIVETRISRPSIVTVGSGRVSAAVPLTGDLPAVSIEPVAVRPAGDGYLLIVTSSGRYGTEANLADEVVAITLDAGHVVCGWQPVAVELGHDVLDVRAMETAGGFLVSIRFPQSSRFYTVEDGWAEPVAARESLTRFSMHDRVPVGGLQGRWLAEVGAGIYEMENDGLGDEGGSR